MRAARATAIVLSGAVLGATLAGCGSYTRGDFVARADAICASTLRATRAVAPPSFAGSGTSRLGALAGYFAKVAPLVSGEARQMRALRRPTGTARQEALLAHYLVALADLAGAYHRLTVAATHGDARGVAAGLAALRTNTASALAARYGMGACAGAGATVG